MPRIAGHISAPPIPIASAAAISQVSFCAAPPSADIEAKIAGAEEEGVASPEHVGEAAPVTIITPKVERVGVDHPLDRVDVVSKYFSIVGRATLIAEKSLAITTTAMPIAKRANQVERGIVLEETSLAMRAAYAKLEATE